MLPQLAVVMLTQHHPEIVEVIPMAGHLDVQVKIQDNQEIHQERMVAHHQDRVEMHLVKPSPVNILQIVLLHKTVIMVFVKL
jgi:hypothetical protein